MFGYVRRGGKMFFVRFRNFFCPAIYATYAISATLIQHIKVNFSNALFKNATLVVLIYS